MNTTPHADLEALLHAFVDGELDAKAEREVRARLETDADAARRVHEYRLQREDLHGLYDEVLDEPLPATMRAQLDSVLAPPPRRMWGAPVWRMAAAIALLFVGGAGGWWGHTLSSPAKTFRSAPYVERAIGAHVVYAAEVRHPVEVAASEEEHLIAWLSKRLGRDVRAPQLGEAGFSLVGGRLLADQDKPAAQFMYENQAGQRITLYVSLNDTRSETSFRIAEQDGTSAIYWIEGGLGYALAGQLPREEMLVIARLVYEALIA